MRTIDTKHPNGADCASPCPYCAAEKKMRSTGAGPTPTVLADGQGRDRDFEAGVLRPSGGDFGQVRIGTLGNEQRVEIGDAGGARMVLDALVRYVDDKPAEAVKAIATLVQAFAPGHRLSRTVGIACGSDTSVYDRMAQLPKVEIGTQPWEGGSTLETARVYEGGVFGVLVSVSRVIAGPKRRLDR
jgi:hypothetical protein